MAISTKEKRILACVEIDADLSVPEIAKHTGLQRHTVQYYLQKLKESQIIERSPFIDIYRLGYGYCGVFFSVHGTKTAKQKLIKLALDHEHVSWFAELAGQYQYGCALAIRTAGEAPRLLNEITDQANVSIFRKSIALRTALSDLPRHYLSTKKRNSKKLHMCDSAPQQDIDVLDHRILSALTNPEIDSYRELARHLGVPHTTLDLRLRNLREAKILQGMTYSLDPRSLGREPFKLLIHARGQEPSLAGKLLRYATASPLAVHFVESVGQWDFEINVEVASAAELAAFVEDIYERFPNQIQDITTVNQLRVTKVSRYPFRDLDFRL